MALKSLPITWPAERLMAKVPWCLQVTRVGPQYRCVGRQCGVDNGMLLLVVLLLQHTRRQCGAPDFGIQAPLLPYDMEHCLCRAHHGCSRQFLSHRRWPWQPDKMTDRGSRDTKADSKLVRC
jgi:hypothetical protein